MVGFDPEAKKKLSKGEHGMAGAISGGLTRFLCQPFDVIKIRFQLQVEPLSHACREAKYWSVSQAAHRIVKEEGFSALWKGHVPAQVLSIVYGVVQFASFEVLTQQTWYLLPHFRGDVYRPAVHFVCGGIAGTLATVFSFPSDVVRTRLVAQGDQKVYRSIPKALTTIYTAEGPRAFFKGLSPTLIQIAPHTGAQFACYSILTTVWKDLVQPKGETEEYVYVSGTGSLVCGSLAGIGAKIFVYPLDVARKRLQIQGFQHGRVGFGKDFTCSGLLDCLWRTARDETVLGLYKGMWPSILKAGVTTALHFCIYEQACQAIAATHS
ncbi:mitochondrial thiamine pyrophosphate carrier isoform X4 [Cryptotermes secundus]|nr:mitochondrial thiamine pyrophosphate carrier isoform X4 [Cryptotermes secundus]XP_023724090.1 mitochondrial thiamine pyrophosphate carrier isoform X4 [Cryptotermes secundus]XP_023724091.1 mitochondrial thiamine pyrophosphate carrier isoform X4 [Cryptotermes secundus]XP_023724092.1 mitochondrial thiamine pyrophosphate carrier isoform X4 [Cryptotermes secundus]